MKKKWLAFGIVLVALALIIVIILTQEKKEEPATGFAAHRIIAHGMGGIAGHAYSNSFDAFIANYEQGTRIFETDLLLSSDGQLVARHEWTANMSKLLGQLDVLPEDRQGAVLGHQELMDTPILELFSPLDFAKILDLMVYYPDAYIVTDTKETDPALVKQQFELISAAASRRDPALLDRIVPQIYSQSMLEEIRKVYPFPHVIYTLYQSQDTDEQVIAFAQTSGVDITMPVSRATTTFVQKLKQTGARIYVHKLNNEQEIKKLYELGVDGFYTDFVSEEDFGHLPGLRDSR
ncbi:phosphatidylinositol-specific phospholipase C/glycerophosphodiester phosphodiesterase family protein [Paenibacillus donghaensis]|uniref:GP-PDE domain-containing protein n=1 Tax=Paenibacillus donghaensis TaxID=414771 RepID=A0A2Z2KED2_9BACL|nr:phosphatidylinositol-specific phospholipase C/glycerophosphodiester phosphodiesterase family protein [Paenibacillus donghaensis]ASA24424.1 hypothetical protein B9T62_28940 [Paenibacillus donghaensis]